MTAIVLAARGSSALAYPRSFLGAAFTRYRDACAKAGATYEAGARQGGANVIDLDRVQALVAALEGSGFVVAVDDSLRQAATRRQAELATVRAGAETACSEMDERLKARGLALYPFQRTGVSWLRSNPIRLLADDMGTGKSIQTLCALPADAPVLVVCPAVAKGVWAREAAKWRPDLKVEALSGRGSFRWPRPGELLSINYDILPSEEEIRGPGAGESPSPLPPPAPGTVVVLDEAHAAKSERTKRALSCRALCGAALASGGRAWALTGTPWENDGAEVYGICAVIGSADALWPKGRTLARWLAENKPAEFSATLSRTMLRREKREVLRELPAKRRVDTAITLDPPERAALDALLAELGGEAAFRALVEAVAEHADDLAEHAARAAESGDIGRLSKALADVALAKLPALLRRVAELEAQGEPVIVMCDHRGPVDALASRTGWARISGDESPEDRTRVEDSFQAGTLKGVACSIRAAGVAITLTRASRMLFVDRAWNPSKNDQAEDRVHRIGQLREVVIERLVAAHPIDRMLHEACSRKEAGRAAAVESAAVGRDHDAVAQASDGLADVATREAAPAPAPSERRANRFPGACRKCGREVAAGAGFLVGSRVTGYGAEHRDGDEACASTAKRAS